MLDDKIELNQRTNQAMARALFKSWFVDFDPVRVPTCQDGGTRPWACPNPSPTSSLIGSPTRSWGKFRRGGRRDASALECNVTSWTEH